MSANAGKVMLGADGCVLRGHDGKIVLADNLYPMHASPSYVEWYRSYSRSVGYDEPPIDNGVWEETWIDGYSTSGLVILNHIAWYYQDGTHFLIRWNADQLVRKYTLSGVDWPRVAKMKVSYLFQSWCSSGYPIPYKWYWGINNATAPSGSNAPWEGTGWTLLANVTATSPTAYDYGVIDVTGCNGTFWLAGFADVTTSPFNPAPGVRRFNSTCEHSFGQNYYGTPYPPLIFDIVYNLAT